MFRQIELALIFFIKKTYLNFIKDQKSAKYFTEGGKERVPPPL